MLDYLYFFFEIIAFAVAVFQLPKLKHSSYVYFIPYLLFILIYEFGSIYNWFFIHKSNLWISNLTLVIFFLFYSSFLCALIHTPYFKRWIKRIVSLSIFLSLVNLAFIQGFWNLNSITILLQFAVLIALTCLYFYELMNSTQKLSISKLPGFWVNTGLLFFCLAEFLFYSAFAYMAYKNNYNYYLLFEVISNIANVILYTCLTISFLCFNNSNYDYK